MTLESQDFTVLPYNSNSNNNNSISNNAVLEKSYGFVDRFPISNQSAETVIWNNDYIDSSIALQYGIPRQSFELTLLPKIIAIYNTKFRDSRLNNAALEEISAFLQYEFTSSML
jgi:hypothetical protein